MSALQDLVVGMLNAVGGGGVGNLASSLLSTSPEAWNSGLYQTALNIHQTAVKPLTAVVLAVMFSMELARNSSRIQDGGELGVKIVAATMFRMAMVMAIAQNANLILQAFDGVTQFMVGGVSHQLSAGGGGPAGPGVGDQMADQVKDAGMTGQLAVLVMLLIPWVLSQLAAVVATVVMYVRFIEIYALTAFQSLPFALLMHEDTKPIAVGYFKSYARTSLNAVTLFICIALYQKIVVDAVKVPDGTNAKLTQWVMGNFGNLMMAGIMLLFVVSVSQRVSRAIAGE
ncbi:type IV secretion system protein [Bifidobacterium sp. ESL0690]|uniref:type IV secretion system protein n=1 Tax=Bifidobacterium sp. ESL0690 TaxID=2983214 RepID=UPI0023F7990D|nr:type IV secretion system protein [Bifidobacterium sp. ESL0690]WEV47633.1 type IV secretion system protein [Bifidobacterium sp. ESL0690]